jgi:hypothetical protein
MAAAYGAAAPCGSKAPAADVTWFLNQVERVFPGTKAAG